MFYCLFSTMRSKRNAFRYSAQHFDEIAFLPFCAKTSFPHPQVYRARLRSTGEEVAVKVQRPGALATISKVSKNRFRSFR